MEQILIAIALMCGPQTQETSFQQANKCQQKLAKCVLDHECGVKKCQPVDLTLMKCVAGQFDK